MLIYKLFPFSPGIMFIIQFSAVIFLSKLFGKKPNVISIKDFHFFIRIFDPITIQPQKMLFRLSDLLDSSA